MSESVGRIFSPPLLQKRRHGLVPMGKQREHFPAESILSAFKEVFLVRFGQG